MKSTSETKAGSAAVVRAEYFYSWPKVMIATAMVLFFVGVVAFWTVLGLWGDHFLFAIVGTIAFFVLLPLLLPFVRAVVFAWMHKGPVVVIDTRGIRDLRKKVDFIPWTDIVRVELGVGETAPFLGVHFDRRDPAREDAPRAGLLGFLIKRFQGLADWNVSLRMLACRRAEVENTANRLRRTGLRDRLAAQPRRTTQDWSGTL